MPVHAWCEAALLAADERSTPKSNYLWATPSASVFVKPVNSKLLKLPIGVIPSQAMLQDLAASCTRTVSAPTADALTNHSTYLTVSGLTWDLQSLSTHGAYARP